MAVSILRHQLQNQLKRLSRTPRRKKHVRLSRQMRILPLLNCGQRSLWNDAAAGKSILNIWKRLPDTLEGTWSADSGTDTSVVKEGHGEMETIEG